MSINLDYYCQWEWCSGEVGGDSREPFRAKVYSQHHRHHHHHNHHYHQYDHHDYGQPVWVESKNIKVDFIVLPFGQVASQLLHIYIITMIIMLIMMTMTMMTIIIMMTHFDPPVQQFSDRVQNGLIHG